MQHDVVHVRLLTSWMTLKLQLITLTAVVQGFLGCLLKKPLFDRYVTSIDEGHARMIHSRIQLGQSVSLR